MDNQNKDPDSDYEARIKKEIENCPGISEIPTPDAVKLKAETLP